LRSEPSIPTLKTVVYKGAVQKGGGLMGAVKVVNKATGELIELQYDSFEDFAMQYDEVTQQIAAFERAKKKIGEELKL
jgi:hypothetical protein